MDKKIKDQLNPGKSLKLTIIELLQVCGENRQLDENL